ncbi:unnamed protein product, partial [Closterium sp. NIES-53]
WATAHWSSILNARTTFSHLFHPHSPSISPIPWHPSSPPAATQIRGLLKPGGLFFLGLPVGNNKLGFDTERM